MTIVSIHKKARLKAPLVDPQDLDKSIPHPEPMELMIEVPLEKAQLDQTIKAKMILLEEKQVQLINFFWKNTKVFT